jgi:hypothetical protein
MRDDDNAKADRLSVIAGVLITLVTTFWILLVGSVFLWASLPAKAIWPASIALGLELVGAAAAFGYMTWTMRRS